jgi:hypothetical protein
MCDERCLGENPKGFPTQRAALGKEDQLRWVGGTSHTRRMVFFRCDSLVQILRVSAVCARFFFVSAVECRGK